MKFTDGKARLDQSRVPSYTGYSGRVKSKAARTAEELNRIAVTTAKTFKKVQKVQKDKTRHKKLYEPEIERREPAGQVDLKSTELFLIAQITRDEMASHKDKKESEFIKELTESRNGIEPRTYLKRMNALKPQKYNMSTVDWFLRRKRQKRLQSAAASSGDIQAGSKLVSMMGLAVKSSLDKASGDLRDCTLADYKAMRTLRREAALRQSLPKKAGPQSPSPPSRVSFSDGTELVGMASRKSTKGNLAKSRKSLRSVMQAALGQKLSTQLSGPTTAGPARETGAEKDRRLGFIAKIYDADESCSSLDSGRSHSIQSSVESRERAKKAKRLDSLVSASSAGKPPKAVQKPRP